MSSNVQREKCPPRPRANPAVSSLGLCSFRNVNPALVMTGGTRAKREKEGTRD